MSLSLNDDEIKKLKALLECVDIENKGDETIITFKNNTVFHYLGDNIHYSEKSILLRTNSEGGYLLYLNPQLDNLESSTTMVKNASEQYKESSKQFLNNQPHKTNGCS